MVEIGIEVYMLARTSEANLSLSREKTCGFPILISWQCHIQGSSESILRVLGTRQWRYRFGCSKGRRVCVCIYREALYVRACIWECFCCYFKSCVADHTD